MLESEIAQTRCSGTREVHPPNTRSSSSKHKKFILQTDLFNLHVPLSLRRRVHVSLVDVPQVLKSHKQQSESSGGRFSYNQPNGAHLLLHLLGDVLHVEPAGRLARVVVPEHRHPLDLCGGDEKRNEREVN